MLQILSLIPLFLADLILLYVLWQMVSLTLLKRVPFISSKNSVIPHIIRSLDLAPGNFVFDLGCGAGKILLAAALHEPGCKYIGYEWSWHPYLLSKFKTRRAKNITIFRKNFFKADLKNADRIYCYLFTEVMDALLPKLEQELKKGAKLISCDFGFSHKEPKAIITIDPKARLGKRLMIYEF